MRIVPTSPSNPQHALAAGDMEGPEKLDEADE
jgi:hypothetical protein